MLAEVLPEADGAAPERLNKLLANESAAGADANGLRRFAALLPSSAAAEAVAARLRLSKRQRERLGALADGRGSGLTVPVRHLAHRIGVDAARDCWLLGGSSTDVAGVLAQLDDWAVPQLPVKGGMLVARGVSAGPQVARLLRQIEEHWVAADFPQGAALERLVDQALSEARQ